MPVPVRQIDDASAKTMILADPRADGRERRVTLLPDRVLVERRVGGIAMRIDVPASAFAGVVVALRPRRTGGTYYELSLLHRDPDLGVLLGEAVDEAIWADWRAWASFFGLPALVERSDGPAEWHPDDAGERGRPALDRRPAPPRRAGFIRRRQAQASAPAVLVRGREIIART